MAAVFCHQAWPWYTPHSRGLIESQQHWRGEERLVVAHDRTLVLGC